MHGSQQQKTKKKGHKLSLTPPTNNWGVKTNRTFFFRKSKSQH